MPKFDKEGNLLVCEEHVSCVMPGQTHKVVVKSKCHQCRKEYFAVKGAERRQTSLEKKEHEIQHMKNCSLRHAKLNKQRKLNKNKGTE